MVKHIGLNVSDIDKLDAEFASVLINKYSEECAKTAIKQIEANGENPWKYPELRRYIDVPKKASKGEMKKDAKIIRGLFDEVVGKRYGREK